MTVDGRIEIRALTPDDLEQAWELEHDAFRVPLERRESFLRHTRPEDDVGAFLEGRLVAMLLVLPLGQYFGGKAVPMGGVASVAVKPEMRGRGLARQLLGTGVTAMRERGQKISTLFPATTRVYRRAGWEVAGSHLYRTIAPSSLQGLPAPGAAEITVREGDLRDLEQLRTCYARIAPGQSGFLDRGDRWAILADLWREHSVFVAESPRGDVDGYLVYSKCDGPTSHLGGPYELIVADLIAATPDAHLALWRLLGSWAPQADKIHYRGAADDPLLLRLPEQQIGVEAELRWMTRILDAPGAIAARGFPCGLSIETRLRVDDPLVAANHGSFTLTIANGTGRLEPRSQGSADEARLDVGAFAALYTGWASTFALAQAGRLTGGTAAERTALDAAFAGAAPWMPDQF